MVECERPHERTPAEHADWLDLHATDRGRGLRRAAQEGLSQTVPTPAWRRGVHTAGCPAHGGDGRRGGTPLRGVPLRRPRRGTVLSTSALSARWSAGWRPASGSSTCSPAAGRSRSMRRPAARSRPWRWIVRPPARVGQAEHGAQRVPGSTERRVRASEHQFWQGDARHFLLRQALPPGSIWS